MPYDLNSTSADALHRAAARGPQGDAQEKTDTAAAFHRLSG